MSGLRSAVHAAPPTSIKSPSPNTRGSRFCGYADKVTIEQTRELPIVAWIENIAPNRKLAQNRLPVLQRRFHWLPLPLPIIAVECGHSDTYDSTILWVPDLKFAVRGYVVYGQVHHEVKRSGSKRSKKKSKLWNRAASSHARSSWGRLMVFGILIRRKKYIEDFGKVLECGPTKE
ncbi:beta-lactamase-like protein [Rostrohypoxylon terebratum]|nr:beta-lactamase-like protein [Rostrohypoxylon terebratum]